MFLAGGQIGVAEYLQQMHMQSTNMEEHDVSGTWMGLERLRVGDEGSRPNQERLCLHTKDLGPHPIGVGATVVLEEELAFLRFVFLKSFSENKDSEMTEEK